MKKRFTAIVCSVVLVLSAVASVCVTANGFDEVGDPDGTDVTAEQTETSETVVTGVPFSTLYLLF